MAVSKPAGPSPRPVLVAEGVEKSFRRGWWPARRRSTVLRGTDLVLAPGEVVGLTGENGSGKSTLMKSAASGGAATLWADHHG